jgi:hypothetical protein
MGRKSFAIGRFLAKFDVVEIPLWASLSICTAKTILKRKA